MTYDWSCGLFCNLRSGGSQFKASPGQIVQETPSREHPTQKRAGRVGTSSRAPI
jgi:hypothetical protein